MIYVKREYTSWELTWFYLQYRLLKVMTNYYNIARIWTKEGIIDAHTKYYLPDEEGFWEVIWYKRGIKKF